jgi:hypothetical protein
MIKHLALLFAKVVRVHYHKQHIQATFFLAMELLNIRRGHIASFHRFQLIVPRLQQSPMDA